jgi:hypothetical protein
MTAIKDFLRDCYQRLTSFAKFAHPIADGNESGGYRKLRVATEIQP